GTGAGPAHRPGPDRRPPLGAARADSLGTPPKPEVSAAFGDRWIVTHASSWARGAGARRRSGGSARRRAGRGRRRTPGRAGGPSTPGRRRAPRRPGRGGRPRDRLRSRLDHRLDEALQLAQVAALVDPV